MDDPKFSVRSGLLLYLGLMTVVIPVSLIIVLIMQKEMLMFYFTIISAVLVISVALFRVPRFLAMIALSFAVMGVAIWAFFSTSIGRGRIGCSDVDTR